ncbi:MAG: DNA translocase FtsK 4TM domain-containing protein [Acidimicrobiales bacterium]
MTTKRAGTHRRGAAARKPSKRVSKSAKGTQRPSIWDNAFFSEHASDLWAIALATLAVIVGLALYENGAGALGSTLDRGLGAVIGWIRFLVPPVAGVIAITVVVGRKRLQPVRGGLATGLGLLSTCGLADLASGAPGPSSGAGILRSAGGYIGALVADALQSSIGDAGSAVLLAAMFCVAAILATGVSSQGLFGVVTSIARVLARATRSLGTEKRTREAPHLHVVPPVEDAADTTDSEYGEESRAESLPDDAQEAEEKAYVSAQPTTEPNIVPTRGDWKLPPLDMLKRAREHRLDQRQLDVAGEALVAKLAAHGVITRLVNRTVGPTVTRFELELGSGVKVARVTSLHRDIAYAMASPDVRILAPIPGKSAIGVEVPNVQRQLVALGDVLSSDEARKAGHPIEIAMGRDISGRAVMVNLAEMPHVLISGATGAGKSSCINSLITSILFRATPDQVRLILVDPKRVELGHYNGLPHLLAPVVVDPKKAANALAWAVNEMERRYDLLAEHGMRDIAGYNEAFDQGAIRPLPGSAAALRRRSAQVASRARAGARDEDRPGDGEEEEADGEPLRLPFIVVVVDELNDLMMVAARDVEESVVRIAQMARAVGIHLVLATQRPSVDVITGVIKANIPARMAFAVSSLADSRVILDQAGAERLIGRGDMLFLSSSSNVTRRIQAPWVSEEEIRATVAYWRSQGGTSESVVALSDEPIRAPRGAADDDSDELLQTALELVVRSQLGSTSMLQRKLRVGFARAGRLMDLLERRGVVGPSEGSKARAVLMSPEDLGDRSA